ncbi:MAG: dihydroneopterin aldolase [Magnetospirillum sp.]|nr:dihydroneopterin aldolase [Magnetospirillum sp.]
MFAAAIAPPVPTYGILVRNLVLPVRIGIHPHERAAPQRVRCSVELAVAETGPVIADHIDEVVNYEYVVTGLRRLAAEDSVNLLETLAEKAAALCLSHPRARRVRITLEKLDAFEDAAAVGVAIERRRGA